MLVAVLTGMRIGEILALQWKRLDLVRDTIEVAETFSDGQFGTLQDPQQPQSDSYELCRHKVFESHAQASFETLPTILCSQHRRDAAQSEKPIQPRSRASVRPIQAATRFLASFRHSHATLLGEVGESLKTAQAILGHSDLETTLNTYIHAIPDSQRRAVERVGDLFMHLTGGFVPTCSQLPGRCGRERLSTEGDCKLGVEMVRLEGLEPSTLGLRVPCSTN